MTSQFSFAFSGDDIEDDGQTPTSQAHDTPPVAPVAAGAFPVEGKALLPPAHHDLDHMLLSLPSKIAFGMLQLDLDGHGTTMQLPRRELWDVRLQLMAEEDETGGNTEVEPGLGKHDVKTGIYEGGFKSWESSVDLVKVLASERAASLAGQGSCWLIELGCGTALPSLAMFQWACQARTSGIASSLAVTLADYNPSVLHLVTLPNFILTWALHHSGEAVLTDAISEGELELTEHVIKAFKSFLSLNNIKLSFMSGAWSEEFVEALYETNPVESDAKTLILGAETIYSPFALASFAKTLFATLRREQEVRPGGQAAALVAAKKLYFGVGGSLEDFVNQMRALCVTVEMLREETDGVRRGVVRCLLP